jgi:hypothetical protein
MGTHEAVCLVCREDEFMSIISRVREDEGPKFEMGVISDQLLCSHVRSFTQAELDREVLNFRDFVE